MVEFAQFLGGGSVCGSLGVSSADDNFDAIGAAVKP